MEPILPKLGRANENRGSYPQLPGRNLYEKLFHYMASNRDGVFNAPYIHGYREPANPE